jgi:hypothetical protein
VLRRVRCVDFFAIVGEPLQACRVTGVAFVGNVVGAARKTIDGLDGSAQASGSSSEATGKFS